MAMHGKPIGEMRTTGHAGLVRDQGGRIVVFAAIAVVAFLAAIPASMWLARAPADLTQTERLGGEIGCTCGTCPHRPIATCGCGFADGMLARLDTEVAAGKSDAEIMAVFVAEYGNGIKIKPEGRGFDLMAWVAPLAFLMVGAVALAGVIAQWRADSKDDDAVAGISASAGAGTAEKGAAAASAGAADTSTPRETGDAASADVDSYRAQVERELDAFDD